jgi:hypothetical protein
MNCRFPHRHLLRPCNADTGAQRPLQLDRSRYSASA